MRRKASTSLSSWMPAARRVATRSSGVCASAIGSSARPGGALLWRGLREDFVVVLLERGTDQSGRKPSEILSRDQLRKFLRIPRQAEAPCCLKHLLGRIRI